MCSQAATQENRPTPLITPTRPWRVAEVEALPDYRLRVRFLDGTEGLVLMAALIQSEQAGVFAALRDPARFAQVRVELGAVTWPGEIDLAPDAMHAAISKTGQWLLS